MATINIEALINLTIKPDTLTTRLGRKKLDGAIRTELLPMLIEELGDEKGAEGLISTFGQMIGYVASATFADDLSMYPPLESLRKLWAIANTPKPDWTAFYHYYAENITSIAESTWFKLMNDRIADRDRDLIDLLAPPELQPAVNGDKEDQNPKGLSVASSTDVTSGSS